MFGFSYLTPFLCRINTYWHPRFVQNNNFVHSVIGLLICGFMLWGQPSSPYEGYSAINPLGMFIGAIIMFGVLGFLPGWIVAKLLHGMGLLRIPKKVELEGLDFAFAEAHQAAVDDVVAAEKTLV